MMTGPWWGWDPTAGPVAVDNGDSTWTFTFSPAPTADMEYLLIVDGVQEDLVAAGTASGDWSCTPVTDYWSYANRQWAVGSGDVTNTYNTCGSCVYGTAGCTDSTASNYDPSATTDDGSCTYCTQATVNFSVDAGAVVSAAYDNVVINGDFANWNGWGVTLTDPDGDGVYEGSLTVDAGSYQYVQALTGSGDGWSGWGVIGNAPAACEVPGTGNYGFTVTCGEVLTLPTVCFASCSACIVSVPGCTDATACNYDPLADFDDGSCEFTSCNPTTCANAAPTGLNATNVLQNRATINWDNMNDTVAGCMVDQYRIAYSDDGGSSWTTKTMGQPVNSCLWATQNTDKLILNLTPSTTYTYRMKAWYCDGSGTSQNSAWSAMETFTTEDDCPNVGNLVVTTPTTTKATFTWDDSYGAYSFTRIKMRVDTNNSTWFNVGGSGVAYGIFTKDKNNLTPGTSYRGQARTWCSPNGGAWKSPTWSSLLFWTQPTTIRLEGGSAITNLNVYPNPSRDIFNVRFTSEDVQNLDVRIINVIGEVVYTENLQQFVGEYTKQVDLATYTKGVYFLEITTDNGVINKKLILQ
jgi:hypothetical protein